MGFYSMLIKKYYPPLKPRTSFAGKTVLITGSNTGIGFEAARSFLELSALHVILGVRTVSKGVEARKKLEALTGRRGAVSVLQIDMDSFSSVRAFVQDLTRDIDIAVLNAGITNRTYETSPDGWEQTLQVNTLSTILLALLLLPKLRSSRVETTRSDSSTQLLPHLVLVSSGTHAFVPRSAFPTPAIDILKTLSKAPEAPAKFSGMSQYGISKLLLMYSVRFMTEIARSSAGANNAEVLIVSCCPGICKSDLGRQYNGWYERWGVWAFQALFARSSEEGGRTLVGAAASGREAQGGYWKDGELKEYA